MCQQVHEHVEDRASFYYLFFTMCLLKFFYLSKAFMKGYSSTVIDFMHKTDTYLFLTLMFLCSCLYFFLCTHIVLHAKINQCCILNSMLRVVTRLFSRVLFFLMIRMHQNNLMSARTSMID